MRAHVFHRRISRIAVRGHLLAICSSCKIWTKSFTKRREVEKFQLNNSKRLVLYRGDKKPYIQSLNLYCIITEAP